MKPIETDRLIMHEIDDSDLGWLSQLMADPEVMRYSIKGPLSEQETRDLIYRDAIESYKKHGFGHYACRLKETGEPIGYCGLTMKEVDGEAIPELGYRLFVEFWGKGYATEAVLAIKEYAFQTLRMPKIISIIEPLNSASIRVAQKNGILYEYSTLFKGINVGIFTAYANRKA